MEPKAPPWIRKEKSRLDLLLVRRGLAETREKAQALILAGNVLVDGQRIDKVGKRFPLDSDLRLLGKGIPYVGRGGLKLEKALRSFGISVVDRIVLDVGASTGGFTDCLLQNGAARVYAVDVGYGQLSWKLRNDPRVVVMERQNVRILTPSAFEKKPDLATIDVSFISLRIVLPKVKELVRPDGEILALVKPQFEVKRREVGKKGVVKDPNLHRRVMEEMMDLTRTLGLRFRGWMESPILGAEGNREFFVHLDSPNGRNG